MPQSLQFLCSGIGTLTESSSAFIINPEVHSLKFASFLSPIVSHLDSRHLSYSKDLITRYLPSKSLNGIFIHAQQNVTNISV